MKTAATVRRNCVTTPNPHFPAIEVDGSLRAGGFADVHPGAPVTVNNGKG